MLNDILSHLKDDLNFLLTIIANRQRLQNTSLNAPQSPTTNVMPKPNNTLVPPPPKPITVPDYLTKMCTAIRDYEGSPGDLNYQNNNPGNCRCSKVGYLPKYGNVLCVDTHSGKFAKFPTYELGWEYLRALVKERAIEHPFWTLKDFFTNYAPAGDNNHPNLYAIYVAAHMGVQTDWQLKGLL